MTLAEFLAQPDVSRSDVVARIGVSRQALHRYCNGDRTPRPDVMRRIREATGGAVTADDFVPAEGAAA